MTQPSQPGDVEREAMEVDVLVVGAGPAGLSFAIKLKQLAPEISVLVLEKAAEVGAHVISGAVIDPSGLDELIPGWREEAGRPLTTEVSDDRFLFLTENKSLAIPEFVLPPLMSNAGNFVGSLGAVTQWLAEKAEALDVDVFPGFAASELIFDDAGAVAGVVTGDLGRDQSGQPTARFEPGMAITAKYTVLAEGARGSLSKSAIAKFNLADGRGPQKYGLGFKEIWQVDLSIHKPGHISHFMGWPLANDTGGGGFVYHYGQDLVSVGFVVHLDYANPYLSPFHEFQRFKSHPEISKAIAGGKRLSYGARALTEGGWQSVPQLEFPGGVLVGCAAGFMNVPRIKGSHNAVHSGIAAAHAVHVALKENRSRDRVGTYEEGWRSGPIGRDLKAVRNVKPLWGRFGTLLGVALAGLEMWVTALLSGRAVFGTMSHKMADHLCLEPQSKHTPIAYPAPDNVVTFDRLSSVYLSNTNHAENQPVHLKIVDSALQRQSEYEVFGGPCARYCPAGVYEWLVEENGAPRLQINAQNCIHCKTCDIKDPNQNIHWVPPQGGEGPIYQNM